MLAGSIALGIALIFSVNITVPRSAQIVDEQGAPVPGAYVFYSHHTPEFFHNPFSRRSPYRSDNAFIRTDAEGKFTIPGKLHFHFPFLQYLIPVGLEAAIYAPALHNFCRIGDALKWDADHPCEPLQAKLQKKQDPVTIKLLDMQGEPELWYYAVFQLCYTPVSSATGPDQDKRELVAQIKKEYEDFALRYADSPREISDKKFVWIGAEGREKYLGQTHPWRLFLEEGWLGKRCEDRIANEGVRPRNSK